MKHSRGRINVSDIKTLYDQTYEDLTKQFLTEKITFRQFMIAAESNERMFAGFIARRPYSEAELYARAARRFSKLVRSMPAPDFEDD
jgi:hypothetical protein